MHVDNFHQKVFSSPIRIQKFLKGVYYPDIKDELIETARNNGAKKDLLSLLVDLKEDEFANPAEVSKAIGELILINR